MRDEQVSELEDEPKRIKRSSTRKGAGIALGAILGAALGAAFDFLALGLALGVAIGALIDVALHQRYRSRMDGVGRSRGQSVLLVALGAGLTLLLMYLLFFVLVD